MEGRSKAVNPTVRDCGTKTNVMLNAFWISGAQNESLFSVANPSIKAWHFIDPPQSFSLSFSLGKPAFYAEYFSLNSSTAELRLLQPISREQHQQFDLIIKVIRVTLKKKKTNFIII